ncbi:hypothetical protein GSI_04984 [Ganoderma sinense ZZ0214-1]|uniref:Uncharacterized protein n=1 Tax=Ganoderma sinense ZZ0214-1 TaxID=1077348 RepID=A0A2G8SGH8_9APHY|nr:hypothetical protein GSI_04984 [Ganoderma sinense ZZ0214-1]
MYGQLHGGHDALGDATSPLATLDPHEKTRSSKPRKPLATLEYGDTDAKPPKVASRKGPEGGQSGGEK